VSTRHVRVSSFLAAFMLVGAFPTKSSGQVSTNESRDDAVAIIAELRKIHTPEGIEVLEQVELGGVSQWISIRGRNRDNPVLLFIHGGPGDPMIGLSWAFQNPWEDYFTVVQWDQRGSGKNAATADRDALRGTLTLDRLVSDAEELIAHLRERLGKDKVVVMSYSLGGVLGIHLAQRRPEWLHAYVGVGQVSHDFLRALYDRTLEIAVARGSAEAVAELQPLASRVEAGVAPAEDPSMWTIWQWASAFDGAWYGKGGWSLYADLPVLAPEYTILRDCRRRSSALSSSHGLMASLRGGRSVRPMLGASMLDFLQGRTDRIHDDGYVTVLYHRGRGFVRQGRWKLANLDPPFIEAELELFDLEADPGETTNLAQREPQVFASMLELWRTTRVELGIILEDQS
jgi:proline iminopeptidase